MPELLSRLQGALADRYRIEREIGAGGMATVYLAQDLRHDRKVALKLMRPELSAVIGAERFLAEIKLTANLQHPHILPLFDSGEADGCLFYVMPLIEGESLRDRLSREKQLPVADAVRIATEVASALDYAHRHGVVHRDIKPENILLHDGRALVADFGIALAASKASGSRMTETGMSLGTPHYMSPEQAMGEREITARSDVYALGAMLYEMLTGDPPFTGSTAQAIVARVLTEAPRAMLPQRHTIPPHVEAAVLTALEKLPADRFATAAQFAEALSGRNYVPTVPSPTAVPTRPMPAAARRRDPVTLALAGVAAAAVAAALWGWLRPAPEPTVNRFSLFFPPEQGLQPVTQSGNRVAISPDGKRLVYIGPAERGGRLWLREHDQLSSTPIAGTEGAGTPFFSPDGRHVGFLINGTILRTVSLDGGPVMTLSDSVNSTGGDWGSDGYVYFEVDSGVARKRSSGGPTELIYNAIARSEVGAEWPVLLPGAKGIVFRTRRANQPPADYQIVGMKLPDGEPKVLLRGVYARYSPTTGHLLVATADGKLIAVPFDADELAVTGSPTGLLEGLGVEGSGFSVNLGLSETGTLVYTTGGATGSRRPVWVSRTGVETPVDPAWQPQGVISNFALSPDGRALAVDVIQNGVNSIWVKQLPVGPYTRLTFGDTSNMRPTWSADGRSIVYLGGVGTNGGSPVMRRADGTGSTLNLLPVKPSWGQALQTRDGRWLVLRSSVFEAGKGNVYGVRMGDTTLVPLVDGPALEGKAAVSPDGRWLGYVSEESGVLEVYVRPFPDAGSARWQVSAAGGTDPVWSRDGRELFYISAQQEMMGVEVAPGTAFTITEPKRLFPTGPYSPVPPVPSFDVHPDGQRFMMLRETTPTDRNELIVVQNWVEEMKARARR